VRRVNPRDVIKPYGNEQSLSMSEAHRLLRRGRVFGPPLFDPQVLDAPASPGAEVLTDLRDDGEPRGIHFFCVNASIKSQFEFVQQTWCNNRGSAACTTTRIRSPETTAARATLRAT
jgi:hypothetical protein